MKKILFLALILSFFLSNLHINAQIDYTYDAAGNRTVKGVPITVHNVGSQLISCTIRVTLDGTENGINYQLYLNSSTLVQTITGNGSSMYFSTVTTNGTYTVIALNPTTVCTSNMNGSVSVALPVPPSAGNNSRCGTGTVTITATPGAGETVDWYSASSGGTAVYHDNKTYKI